MNTCSICGGEVVGLVQHSRSWKRPWWMLDSLKCDPAKFREVPQGERLICVKHPFEHTPAYSEVT